jgi:hypothetical protein
MTTKARWGRGLLTPQPVTGITSSGATELTPQAVTKMTPKPVTRRAYKKRARKCKCGCGRTVDPTPQAPHKVYFDDACRQRDHRAKRGKGRPRTQRREVNLDWMYCEFCGHKYLGATGKGRKYCKPSHKVAAAEARREAAIAALIASTGEDEQVVRVALKGAGMRKASTWLKQQGYVYSEQERRWLLPVVATIFVHNEVG